MSDEDSYYTEKDLPVYPGDDEDERTPVGTYDSLDERAGYYDEGDV